MARPNRDNTKIKMKKIFISITVLPDEKINSAVLSLNQTLSKKIKIAPIDFTDTEFAHVSLYNATFPDYNLSDIKNTLNIIFQNAKTLELVPEKIKYKYNFISIVFKKTDNISNLQDVIIDRLNPLREGMLQSKYIEQAEVYSAEELSNAHLYGYPFCRDQFSPHMTIATLEDISDAEQAINELEWKKPISLTKASVRILFTNDKGEKIRDVIYFTF